MSEMTRAEQQAQANMRYALGEISRDEWKKITDELSFAGADGKRVEEGNDSHQPPALRGLAGCDGSQSDQPQQKDSE